ncbi:MAG: acetate--CoA ligase [Gammaproteobacteria bacterium]|nr:acetate--CoA ligase [Gammaproteobacteria bacterium]
MDQTYSVMDAAMQHSHLSIEQYQTWYRQSINQPEQFWGTRALEALDWYSPWQRVCSSPPEQFKTKWFEGAQLNAAYNCLDRHLATRKNQIAIIWEGDDPNQSDTLTYAELYERVCRMSNVLKRFGIKRGERVCIYLPMIVESVIAMLACARIGAVHSVVFAGFSAESLKTRILDADCRLVITANVGFRQKKVIPLKQNVDMALLECPKVNHVLVVKRSDDAVVWEAKRDYWYHDEVTKVTAECPPEIMDAQDPLFILYTSGSTGTPKGILHGTGGYLVYTAMTFKYVFDYRHPEIFWCTADVGWITGHSYCVYGPLLNGATTIIFEGVPQYPTPARYWEIVDKYKVNIFYTAPTAIRALRREGDQWVQKSKRHSLRLLGTVGELINPEAWEWYYRVVGEHRCPIVDTWWQTETGGIMIAPLPGVTPLKPGSASWPFFGIVPEVVNDQGAITAPNEMGKLVITQSWPSMMLTVNGDHARFQNYFSDFPGSYFTGDQAYRDQDGYFWISGRSDDVIKVSGHRIGTQEVENALVSHPSIAEAAVVGLTDAIKGQVIYAFVTLKLGVQPSLQLREELIKLIRAKIGAIAVPQCIQWVEMLPKTRSGKIMRRLLRKIANQETDDLGDLSTLADATVVDKLITERCSYIKKD